MAPKEKQKGQKEEEEDYRAPLRIGKIDRRVPISEYLTYEDVMRRLGVSRPTVAKRILGGYLHPVKKGRSYLFNPHEVDAEIERIERLFRAHPGATRVDGNDKYIGGVLKRIDDDKGKAPLKRSRADLRRENRVDPVEPERSQFGGIRKLEPKSVLENQGKLAAEAFAAFEKGASRRKVVMDLKLRPVDVQYLWEAYCDLDTEWLLTQRSLARVRRLIDWNESPPTVAGFEKAVHAFIRSEIDREIARMQRQEHEKGSDNPQQMDGSDDDPSSREGLAF